MFLRRSRLSTEDPFPIILEPDYFRPLADGEGEGGDGGSGGEGEGGDSGQGAEGTGDEGGQSKPGEGEGAADGADGDGRKPGASQEADWRAGLKTDDAKKFAESSPDIEHLVNRALDMRRQLSTAVVRPGKDAKPEEIAAYRARIGVPENPDGYEFTSINDEPTEVDRQFFGIMGKLFHEHDVPAETAKALNAAFNEFSVGLQKAQVEADKEYAEATEADLRKLWGAEWDKNNEFAQRAAAAVFGDDFEEAKSIEMKTGKFLLDHPLMVRAFAAVGREMAEGGLVPPLDDSARDAIDDQAADLQKRINKAQADGNDKEANRLYQEKLALLDRKLGRQPIVGAPERAA